MELGPGHGDIVGAVRDVEVTIGTIGDVAMINPDTVGVLLNGYGVIARRAPDRRIIVRIQRAIADRITHDLDIAQDHVRAATQLHVSVDLCPANACNRFVGSDGDLS